MIPQNFEYSRPANLSEALGLLEHEGAKPLAGGMSLIPLMKLRFAAPEQLIDISRLSELNYIREEGGKLHIGAGATHYEIESSPVVRAKCPLLADVASNIGDIQVRNTGTIGGSTAHADPAADYPAALFALEAQIKIVKKGSERTVSVDDFFVDTFTTALQPGELIQEIIVPIEDNGVGTSYHKVAQPASGFAIVGIAVRVRKGGSMARIGVTGLANKPYRARNVEQKLESGTAVADAVIGIADGVDGNSDLHASSAYRAHLASVHAVRAINQALSRII